MRVSTLTSGTAIRHDWLRSVNRKIPRGRASPKKTRIAISLSGRLRRTGRARMLSVRISITNEIALPSADFRSRRKNPSKPFLVIKSEGATAPRDDTRPSRIIGSRPTAATKIH